MLARHVINIVGVNLQHLGGEDVNICIILRTNIYTVALLDVVKLQMGYQFSSCHSYVFVSSHPVPQVSVFLYLRQPLLPP